MDLEYYEISVPDRNDSIMRVNLDEVYYNLRLTWNAYGGSCQGRFGISTIKPKEVRRAFLVLKRSRKQLAAMILWMERQNCYTFLQNSLECNRWTSGIDSTE